MNQTKPMPQKTSLSGIWQDFKTRCYFKFVLPRRKEAIMDGLRLDLTPLSLKARNRIINVGYETFEKQLCREFLSPKDSVMEIGAAIGVIGLYCQKVIAVDYYIAFEANPRTLEILRTNFQLNGLKANAWNMALAPDDGQVELNVDSDFWDNSIVEGGTRQDGKKTMAVPAATLRTLFKTAGRRINVLIIDIEGAEQFIDVDQIPEEVDKIIIELHPQIIGKEKTDGVISRLVGKGFALKRESGGTFAFLKNGVASKQNVSIQKFEPVLPVREAQAVG